VASLPCGAPGSQYGAVVDVAPFPALRYDPAVAGPPFATSAPAYDEFGRFAYAGHRAANPYTILELLASRQPGDYDAAAATLRRWRRTGVLVMDADPALYLYEEHELRGGVPAVQRGLLGAVRLGPLGMDVLAHERVEGTRIAERTRRLEAVPLDVSPVFALYRDAPAELAALLDRPPRRPPVAALTDEEGVDHRVWRLDDPEEITKAQALLAEVPVMIADGHHRYASALAYRERRMAAPHDVDAPWERTLMYLVDAERHGPELRAIHRVVGKLPDDALARLSEAFEVSQTAPERLSARLGAVRGPAVGLRLPDRGRARERAPAALIVRPRGTGHGLPAGGSKRWRQLDAAFLHDAVVPALGIDQPLRYTPDAKAAVTELDAVGQGALFLLRPVAPDVVFDLARTGEPLPPKTTYFRPKPRAGLIMRMLDP
jgi:uncharacterized protein (DUF1015 family)